MKYKIKRRRKTIKTRYIFFALVLALICISISYARQSSVLRINGTATSHQEQYNVTYLYFENSSSYPSTIGHMSTYTYTFTEIPVIQSIIMGERTLVRDTDYTYTNGTLTIPNVDGNLVIQAEAVGEDVWVTYHFGDETFSGTKYINTGIPLFSADNVNRDFEISMDLSNFQYLSGQDTNRNVFLCNQNEAAEPYQGFAFQYRESKFKIQANGTGIGDYSEVWDKTSGNITFTRTNNVLYQDGNLVYDFADVIVPFNAPLSIGANLAANGNARRFCKANLSNIIIKLKYSYSEYLSLCQNLPAPVKPANNFDGWYTSLEGGTEIVSKSQLDANGRNLYLQWASADKVHVTFNANGGTGTMGRQEVPYNVQTNLTQNEFVKDGYRFVGWSTTADGLGLRYSDEGSIKITEDTTLYAIWLSNPKTIYTASTLNLTGSKAGIVDTGLYLFSEENLHKNFEMYFEIDNISTNTNQSTIMNSKDESGTPYPGIVFRIDSNATKLTLKADARSGASKRIDKNLDAVQKVRIIRINDVTYYSLNDASYQLLMDFTNIYRSFDAPVAFGGIIKPDGGRDRAFNGTLSNICVQFISDTATLEEYQNALP